MRCDCLSGIPVSQGIAYGPAFLYCPEAPQRKTGGIAAGGEQAELDRLNEAVKSARGELEGRIAQFTRQGREKTEIFGAHLEILDDPCMTDGIKQRIAEEHICCEQAIWDTYQEILDAFADIEDPVFRERAADLTDVRNRLLRCCEGRPEPDLSRLKEPMILIARDLTPSDMTCLPQDAVLAIATEIGGGASHTAILARAWGIPAVLGVEGLTGGVQPGQTVIVDAEKGCVIANPGEEVLADYRKRQADWLRDREESQGYLGREAVTLDGTRILTEINLGSVEDAHSEAAAWADGVGLLRTEFLYMESEVLPDEETQYQTYGEILRAFGSRPVILRTLDIGGDKRLPYLELPKEDNPFLGLRALRFCFAHEELFRIQLRAAYRASVHGNLWIMFPMVTDLEDFRRAKKLCLQVQRELEEEGVPFRRDVRLGIMIEIPAIALMADLAARETDFASIGTNDLCQYVCAADRLNSAVAPYYNPKNPGLLRLLAQVAKAYADAGKPVGVCGEMASDPRSAPILVGLGIRCLSMSGASLGGVRRALSQSSLEEMQRQAEKLLSPCGEESEG